MSTENADLEPVEEGAERRSRRSYDNIVRAITETPWAIRPSTFAVIADIMQRRLAGEPLSEAEIRERIGASSAAREPQRVAGGAIAMIPLYGVIIPRATLFSEMSGGTSLQRFQSAFRQALNDPDVGSILIDVDSPGGSTDLVPETASMIRSGRDQKPVTAIANTDAASAAYWLASQASELVVTPSGAVGSIGVFAAHEDWSKFDEMMGVKTTLIHAGRFKVETNPFEPLTEEARAYVQGLVDEFYGMFVRDVGKGRGKKASAVRSEFGEGRMVTASRALELGMVDRVDTFENTVTRMARAGGQSRASAVELPVPFAGDVELDDSTGDEEVHEPAQAELVDGAERLLSRRAIRSLGPLVTTTPQEG